MVRVAITVAFAIAVLSGCKSSGDGPAPLNAEGKPTNQGEGVDGYLADPDAIVFAKPDADADARTSITAPAGTVKAVSGNADQVQIRVFELAASELDRFNADGGDLPALGVLLARSAVAADGGVSVTIDPPRPAGVAVSFLAQDDPDLQRTIEKDLGATAIFYDFRTGQRLDVFGDLHSGIHWQARREVLVENADDPKETCRIAVGEWLEHGPPVDWETDGYDSNELQFLRVPEHCALTKRNGKAYYLLIPGWQSDWFVYKNTAPAAK